jgi:glyoxylase-like metal-dependent hydrolase (beta-lactamase superfamily II)
MHRGTQALADAGGRKTVPSARSHLEEEKWNAFLTKPGTQTKTPEQAKAMEKQLTAEVAEKERPHTDYDVADDVAGLKLVFVNVFFVGKPRPGGKWVLVDAGLTGTAGRIKRHSAQLFGENNPPQAIVLTHGHFDHVGALNDLLQEWDVPVYAHPLEMPYLTGKSAYPPPDPAIGGGAMSVMSFVFPTGPEHFGDRIRPIPHDGFIPELDDWRAIHTPGHAPGHVSLFRERDKVLLAGDAFVTTNQNSALAVMKQSVELHGPPAYFTCDWRAARKSVKALAKLKPSAVGTGHGVSIRGKNLKHDLQQLADEFDALSIPSPNGRYVKRAARTDETGVVDMPTPVSFYVARGLAVGALLGLAAYFMVKNRRW